MEGTEETQGALDISQSTTLSASSEGGLKSLRRVRDEIPKRLWAVALIGFWERAAFWGLTAPWQNYMQHPLDHKGTPGALGLGQAQATRIYCAFYVFYYLAPLAFAVISDRYLGRYRTLLISVILYSFGCTVLTVSSYGSNLEKGWGLPGLVITMVATGLGGGGFQAILVPFIGDQCTEQPPRIKTLESGERVLVDRSLTLQYIYNTYYWLANVGALSSLATVTIEKKWCFAGAYGLALIFVIIAAFMLTVGRTWYIRIPHEAGILPQATKILLCASRNGFRMARTDPTYQLEHRHKRVTWSSALVAELVRGLRACRLLLGFIIFYVCFDQMQNNLISQASQMETHGVPNDLLPAMNQVGCIVLVPLVQHVLYPFLHRRNIYIEPITRITIGFGFIALAMLYATITQQLIYTSGPCYKHPMACSKDDRYTGPNEINVWFQTPIYFLISAGEVFAAVTALEYAYSHAPKDMKSVVQAISLLLAGVGSACAMGLTPIAHDPYLVIFYACLAGAMAITTVLFWFLFRRYDRNHPNEASDDASGSKLELKKDDASPSSHVATILSLALQRQFDPTTTERDVEQGLSSDPEQTKTDATVPPNDIAVNTEQNISCETECTVSDHPEVLANPNHQLPIAESEDTRWESPRNSPPIPSWRVSKGLIKETPQINPKLDCELGLKPLEDDSAVESAGSPNSPGPSPSLPARIRSSVYETAYEHLTSSDNLVSADDEASLRQGSVSGAKCSSPADPSDHGSCAQAVPNLVARFEELSRSSSGS